MKQQFKLNYLAKLFASRFNHSTWMFVEDMRQEVATTSIELFGQFKETFSYEESKQIHNAIRRRYRDHSHFESNLPAQIADVTLSDSIIEHSQVYKDYCTMPLKEWHIKYLADVPYGIARRLAIRYFGVISPEQRVAQAKKASVVKYGDTYTSEQLCVEKLTKNDRHNLKRYGKLSHKAIEKYQDSPLRSTEL